MILIKEITESNIRQFDDLPNNILVVAKGLLSSIGIIVCRTDDWAFYIHFADGTESGLYNTVIELIRAEGSYFSFYYIEIKKQS